MPDLASRPNEIRRATLMALLVYGHIEIQRDNDQRLKGLMGLVELGELMVTEMHATAPGVIYRKFTLTERGTKAAKVIAPL